MTRRSRPSTAHPWARDSRPVDRDCDGTELEILLALQPRSQTGRRRLHVCRVVRSRRHSRVGPRELASHPGILLSLQPCAHRRRYFSHTRRFEASVRKRPIASDGALEQSFVRTHQVMHPLS
jgi:hypothetical protein